MDRHVELPARSQARTMIVLVPLYSLMFSATQVAPPRAVPLPPVLVVQVTLASPPLSFAVPRTVICACVVAV